jgi:glutamyl/glutaminyl-tRNA synthetase
LPETLLNYLALLGWTPADGRELLTQKELAELFTLDRLSASPSRFDLKKVQWLNGQHIRMLPVEELRDRVVAVLKNAGFDVDAKPAEWLTHMTAICQEKIKTLNEIVAYTDFFFVEPAEYEEKAVKKQWGNAAEATETLETIKRVMESAADWTHDALKAAFEALCAETGKPIGHYIHPTRLALTGKSVGPGLFELAELLGKETCLARIGRAMDYVNKLNTMEG